MLDYEAGAGRWRTSLDDGKGGLAVCQEVVERSLAKS